MSLNEDLKNCRIVIRDMNTGRTLLDTTVLSYDAEKAEIEIRTDRVVLKENSKISILLFLTAGLYEIQGIVHEKLGKKTRIVLYENEGNKDRQAVRYLVNFHGNIEMIERTGEGKRETNFEIVVQNMSSTGILLQAPRGMIQENDIIKIASVARGQRITITAKVMRLHEQTSKKEKFGCSILLVNLA